MLEQYGYVLVFLLAGFAFILGRLPDGLGFQPERAPGVENIEYRMEIPGRHL